jgi:DNA-binding response OmpR family regulator
MANKKILIIDDGRDLFELVRMRLEANDYETITAYDGQEALEKARKEKPDLIILDLMLPKISLTRGGDLWVRKKSL